MSKTKSVLLCIIIAVQFVSLLPIVNASPEVTILSIPEVGSTTVALEGCYESTKIAVSPSAAGQNFPLTRSYYLTRMSFKLSRQGAPQGTLTARIFRQNGTYDVNAKPLGTAGEAESTNAVNFNDITNVGGAQYTFYFNNYLMTEQYYWAVVLVKTNTTVFDDSNLIWVWRTAQVIIGDICYYQNITYPRWMVYDGQFPVRIYGRTSLGGMTDFGNTFSKFLPLFGFGLALAMTVAFFTVTPVNSEQETVLVIVMALLSVMVILLGINALVGMGA